MVATTLTKTVRGMHVLDIHDFSSVRKKQCDAYGFLYSPTFTVGGLDWAVRSYPDDDIYPRCWRQLGAVGPRGRLRRASDRGRRGLGARQVRAGRPDHRRDGAVVPREGPDPVRRDQ
ncbi:hypothetical protein ZWY2020_052841 [Hordeum vulgare]|nr:hypothetical protein ZWY2020_052841 [Hordeum vulgare]